MRRHPEKGLVDKEEVMNKLVVVMGKTAIVWLIYQGWWIWGTVMLTGRVSPDALLVVHTYLMLGLGTCLGLWMRQE